MTVCTYFAPIWGSDKVRQYRNLLTVWRRAWQEAGFNPVVLEEGRTQVPERVPEIENAFANSVTVNDRTYEVQCYLRWAYVADLAARFAGPVLSVDGDTFPNPECRSHGFFRRPASFWNGEFHVLDVGVNPCAVLTDGVSCQHWIDVLLENMATCRAQIGGRDHTSDMVISQHTQPRYPIRLCAPWGHPTGSEYPLVHVGTDQVKAAGESEDDKAGFVLRRVGTFRRGVRK